MRKYEYLDEKGTFRLEDPEMTNYLYFPLANEAGTMSCVTPTFGGDLKTGQNTFLLEPVSNENLHNNKSSRNFWCSIKGEGIWSATGKSAGQQAELFTDEKDRTVLTAGIMRQTVKRTSVKYQMSAEITSFVPCGREQAEIMQIVLINTGHETRKITPVAAVPIYGRSADNIRDHRHVTSLLNRIETVEDGVILTPTLTFDERGHKANTVHYGVFGRTGQGECPIGFYPLVSSFIGEGGSLENPGALYQNTKPVKSGSSMAGNEAMGAICFDDIVLKPGAKQSYIIAMGFGDTREGLIMDMQRFLSDQACEKALTDTSQYWEEKINVVCHSGMSEFDEWMYWVNFQPMLRRIFGCSFLPQHDYGKGGRGWRDLWQDCLALLIMNPGGVRQMLIDNFGGVRMDGTNATIIGAGQGEFIADRNNITRVWMDHGAWPLFTTDFYISQTGDLDILLIENYYFKDLQAMRGEGHDASWTPQDGSRVKTATGEEYRGTILEHILVEHLTEFYDVGDHGHLRLRGADWNDALDMAKEKGESIAFTAFYAGNLELLAGLFRRLSEAGVESVSIAEEMDVLLTEDQELYADIRRKQELLDRYCASCKCVVTGVKKAYKCSELAKNLTGKAIWMKEHIRDTEWITDGNGESWFNSYYDNHGRQVEGDHENGVRMMLTGQVFAIMSGTATTEQIKQITAAADRYLYEPKVGGYRLNTDFQEVKSDLGRMFGFAYGHKENGAVFSHMAVMYANALYRRGFVPEGYKVIRSLFDLCNDFGTSRIYPGVPEYIDPEGRGMYPYLTGSASWLMLTVLTEMYGIKGEYGDLLLEPRLLMEQFDKYGTAGAELVFAGRSLNISYRNAVGRDYGEYEIGAVSIDRKPYECQDGKARIARSDIEALDASETHEIQVTLN